MNKDIASEIWKDSFKKRMSYVDYHQIELWEITEAQLRYMIKDYGKDNIYQSTPDFLRSSEELIRAKALPDDLCCKAYLSDKTLLVHMAEEIQELEAAWVKDPQVDKEIFQIRKALGYLV